MKLFNKMIHNHWEGHRAKGVFSPATRLLGLFSYLYGMGVTVRFFVHRKTEKRILPGFVVSIGNLTVGGTGKTPATSMLATWALGEGYRVAVLSRGYGGRSGKNVLEVSDGHAIKAGPAEAGDEPYLLAKNLHGIPVVISKKRYDAGLMAHEKYDTNFYILDDGFQHLSLRRNLDLVLMDASRPLGNGHLLPLGPLREPVDHLRRADAFVFTRFQSESSDTGPMASLVKKFPDKPVFQSGHMPDKLVFPNTNGIYAPEFLKGKRVAAFAGIARPDVFRDTLVRLGAELVSFGRYGDHHTFTAAEVRELILKKESHKADLLLTTEKDWVRMENLTGEYSDLAYLTVKFSLLGGESRFFKMIEERVGRT
jgi:tetraacyldisaccharide 4'-kinase